LQAVRRIRRIMEVPAFVVGLEQPPGDRVVPAVVHDRRTEEHTVLVHERREVIEYDTLLGDGPREAVEKIVHANGIKFRQAIWYRLRHVVSMDFRRVSPGSTGRVVQAVLIDVHEAEPGVCGGVPAVRDIVPSTHADIEVVSGDMLVVHPEQARSRASPAAPVTEAENKESVVVERP